MLTLRSVYNFFPEKYFGIIPVFYDFRTVLIDHQKISNNLRKLAICVNFHFFKPIVQILINKHLRDDFRNFLKKEHSEENLDFLLSVLWYQKRRYFIRRLYGRFIVRRFIALGGAREIHVPGYYGVKNCSFFENMVGDLLKVNRNSN